MYYKATFKMRCDTLLTMLLVNILLANITEMAKREIDPRHKPGGVFCKANPKSSQMGAAKDAHQRAKDLACQQVKPDEKKQQLDKLLDSLAETRDAMEEVQRSIAVSSAFIKTVCRIRDKTRQRLAILQGLYKEEIDTMRRMVANARQLVIEKQSLVDAAKRRVEELHTLLKKAQAVLHRNRELTKKASCFAAEARKRIGTMTPKTDGSPSPIPVLDFLR